MRCPDSHSHSVTVTGGIKRAQGLKNPTDCRQEASSSWAPLLCKLVNCPRSQLIANNKTRIAEEHSGTSLDAV
jgi:hypothetical protein